LTIRWNGYIVPSDGLYNDLEDFLISLPLFAIIDLYLMVLISVYQIIGE